MNSEENVPSGMETYSRGELMELREFTGEVGIGDERSENGYTVIKARIFVSKLMSLPSSENSQAIDFYRGNGNLFASLFYDALGDVMSRIAIVGEKSSRWNFPDNVVLRKFIDQYRD